MAHSNIEIEIQVQVERIEPLLAFLQSQGQFQKEAHQKDEYFSPGDKDYLKTRPVKEWLRLREANGTATINYKDWHYNEAGKSENYCTEYETKIGDYEQLHRILTALGFTPIVRVEKVRKTYSYKDFEIAIDSVKGLGEFVEVEYCESEHIHDAKRVTADMVAFLKEVGCGTIRGNSTGYPFLLLFPNEAVFEIL